MNQTELSNLVRLLGVVSRPETRTREAMHEICTITDDVSTDELALAAHQYILSLLLIEQAEAQRELAIATGEIRGMH